jgi:hypothetical protein
MQDYKFKLVGHDNPLKNYPAPVVPVGYIENRLVAVYSKTNSSDIVQIEEDSVFIKHSPLLAETLRPYDYLHHRLFAFSETNIVHYSAEYEDSFFRALLEDLTFSENNPFLRLTIAKPTKDLELIKREIYFCSLKLKSTSIDFAALWYSKELETLKEEFGSKIEKFLPNQLEELILSVSGKFEIYEKSIHSPKDIEESPILQKIEESSVLEAGDHYYTHELINEIIVPHLSPFRLMLVFFLGLTLSLFYGGLSTSLLFYLEGSSNAVLFFAAYTTSFKTLISLGFILGTTLVFFQTKNIIPETIEANFTESQLSETDYFYYKRRFFSLRLSITFLAQIIVIAFFIFSYCRFPLQGQAEVLMMIAACAQYAFGAYVCRKLLYAVMMLYSLRTVTVTRNLFQKRELDRINPYVSLISTLMIISVYIHVKSYYGGAFLYDSLLGQSLKPFLILPALITMPVLLTCNFYPRIVLEKLYRQSINVQVKSLQEVLQTLSMYEKRYYLMEFNKIARTELNNNRRFTVGDLLVCTTILIMMFQFI